MMIYLLTLISGILVFWAAATLGYRLFYLPFAMAGGAQAGGAAAGPAARTKERRRTHRFAAAGDAVLSWQTDTVAASSRGGIVNLSETGLAVKSSFDLSPGTYVYVEVPHLQSATTGTVRYSVSSGRRWIVGVEFRGGLFPR